MISVLRRNCWGVVRVVSNILWLRRICTTVWSFSSRVEFYQTSNFLRTKWMKHRLLSGPNCTMSFYIIFSRYLIQFVLQEGIHRRMRFQKCPWFLCIYMCEWTNKEGQFVYGHYRLLADQYRNKNNNHQVISHTSLSYLF